MDNNNSITGKLLAAACWAALVAFVFGLCLGRTLIGISQDRLDFIGGMVLSGALFLFLLFWARRVSRGFATSGTAKKRARQFLASCIFFSILSSTCGVAVSGLIWYSLDFIRAAGAICSGVLTCIAIYPVRRDAKRLGDPGPNQIASN